MSFREGHYFSFDENKNYTGGENNHPEIQISEYTSEELSKLWLKTLKKGCMAFVSACMKTIKNRVMLFMENK